ncbi:MAG: hypothetical protein OXQ29_03415 [Rhodospirillaceae bacterium]|nr:hypothetical protein [Rhodospirillaceae bacterium]
MARQTGSIERPRRGFGTTPGGRAFVWLLTLTSVAVVLAVWFSFRGASEGPQESPAEAGAAGSTPSTPASGALEVPPAVVLPPLPVGPHTAWQPLEIDSVAPERLPEYKEIVEGRVLVELSTGMWSWGEGDRITLAVPQTGAVYEPVIERVETMLGNNRSYVGRLIEAEFPYSFVITVGQRNTFANFSTPQGSFELVGDTELAWLMPVANMDQHVDYSQPDYYIPGDDFPGESSPAEEIPDGP